MYVWYNVHSLSTIISFCYAHIDIYYTRYSKSCGKGRLFFFFLLIIIYSIEPVQSA